MSVLADAGVYLSGGAIFVILLIILIVLLFR